MGQCASMPHTPHGPTPQQLALAQLHVSRPSPSLYSPAAAVRVSAVCLPPRTCRPAATCRRRRASSVPTNRRPQSASRPRAPAVAPAAVRTRWAPVAASREAETRRSVARDPSPARSPPPAEAWPASRDSPSSPLARLLRARRGGAALRRRRPGDPPSRRRPSAESPIAHRPSPEPTPLPVSILLSGFGLVDVCIPMIEWIMREKLRRSFAHFLSKCYVSTCRTSASLSSPSCSMIQPWLFVGLGNPGEKYQCTRHNVGFDMIDAFALSQGISLTTHHFKALFGEGMVNGVPILLAKPQTYMNLSGESAGPLAAYYKLPLNRVLVAFDDMDLPCGVLRLQPKGGYGRHNGVRSVIHHFRNNLEFGRLRIGIGRPPGQMDPKAFVLQKFNKTGRERIDSAKEEGVEILKMVATKGLAEAARLSNVDQKYKHLRSLDLQM